MPALVLFVAHIGNDALAVPCVAGLLACLSSPRKLSLKSGLLLAAALLTKGYALVLLPLFALRARKALLVALVLSAWWYAANILSTGSLAGDQMDVAAHATLFTKLMAVPQVAWLRVVDSAATTHIWIGGWSFLQLRSWMYRLWELLALIAIVGLIRLPKGHRPTTLILAQSLFLLATAYFSLNTFVAMHTSVGVGWYLIAMSAAEATLLAAGFTGLLGVRKARIAMAATALLALALDLYTVHFLLLPYYTGAIRHRLNGSLEAFHFAPLPLPALWPST